MIRLFLDLDGVLHPQSAVHRPEQHLRAAPLLEQALDGLDVEIVVCSTWRLTRSLAELQASLSEACSRLGRRVVGVTPKCSNPTRDALSRSEPRWAEAAHYQLQHGSVPCAALDDWDNYGTQATGPGAWAGHLGFSVFHPDPRTGITRADLGQIRQVILGAGPLLLDQFRPKEYPLSWPDECSS